MPIHNLGYRDWEGLRESPAARWLVVTGVGVRLAWRIMWLRRMLTLAWAPALIFATGFLIFEQAVEHEDHRRLLAIPLMLNLPDMEHIRPYLTADSDLSQQRHAVWSVLLLSLFRYPQAVSMVIIIGLIAPGLISRDLRSRAYLVYFSRPLTRGEYILGKMAVIWFYVATITTLPALGLFVLGVMLSPDLSVVWDTWDIPLRIIAASLILIVPTTCLAVCFSSCTQESRFAGFAWFAVWILGSVSYTYLTTAAWQSTEVQYQGQRIRIVSRDDQENQRRYREAQDRWAVISPYHSLARLQKWVFGIEPFSDAMMVRAAVMLAICVISTVTIYNRVGAPMRT